MATERLKVEIEQKRAALAEARADLDALHRELDGFARQYDRIVGSLEAQLDKIREEIESLMGTRPLVNETLDFNELWGPDYMSVEAQYRRAMDPNFKATPFSKGEFAQSQTQRPGATDLKKLYRQLARQYHPDTSTDPEEKLRLTVLMAQINAAYRAKDVDELYRLSDRKPEPMPVEPPARAKALATEPTTYAELLALAHKLDDEVAWTRSERLRLGASPLMHLKIEWSLARSRGRDLLQEIAQQVRADIDAANTELNALRKRR
ncbi:MAG TPA: hypothetical protein VMT34_17715 [Aggregatilineales bacterium]|nr:hypothetical protein [Aggregatilineales bacterium]